MHLSEIIVKPVLTEETYKQMAAGIYTFIVNHKANKSHVKKAYEQIFEVKVADVNIINSKPKIKAVGQFIGKTSAVQKALIKWAPGEELNLFSSEEQS